MGHGAWCITVRVSEHVLAHYGAMPHAPCDKALHGAQYERSRISRVVRAQASNCPFAAENSVSLPDVEAGRFDHQRITKSANPMTGMMRMLPSGPKAPPLSQAGPAGVCEIKLAVSCPLAA